MDNRANGSTIISSCAHRRCAWKNVLWIGLRKGDREGRPYTMRGHQTRYTSLMVTFTISARDDESRSPSRSSCGPGRAPPSPRRCQYLPLKLLHRRSQGQWRRAVPIAACCPCACRRKYDCCKRRRESHEAWHPQGPIRPQPHPVPLHLGEPPRHQTIVRWAREWGKEAVWNVVARGGWVDVGGPCGCQVARHVDAYEKEKTHANPLPDRRLCFSAPGWRRFPAGASS